MISALRQAYAVFSRELFNAEFPVVEFVFSASRKHILFFREPNTIEIGNGVVNANGRQVLDALLHQMVHIHNFVTNHQDISNHCYHKSCFCEIATRVGLIVVFRKNTGWSNTTSDSNEVLSEANSKHPNIESAQKLEIAYERVSIRPDVLSECQQFFHSESKGTRQYQFKYICQCDPPTIVRVGRRPDGVRPLLATCDYCGSKFKLADADSGVDVA